MILKDTSVSQSPWRIDKQHAVSRIFRIIVVEPVAILPITWRPRGSGNTTQRRQLLLQSRTPRRWYDVVDQDRDRELPAIFPRPSFQWPSYWAVDSPRNAPHSSDPQRQSWLPCAVRHRPTANGELTSVTFVGQESLRAPGPPVDA